MIEHSEETFEVRGILDGYQEYFMEDFDAFIKWIMEA